MYEDYVLAGAGYGVLSTTGLPLRTTFSTDDPSGLNVVIVILSIRSVEGSIYPLSSRILPVNNCVTTLEQTMRPESS